MAQPSEQAKRVCWLRGRWLLSGVLVVLLVLPVPWLHLTSEDPPGWVWRLDGRLVVQGQTVNPPGEWSWLTVGRPPVVLEVLRDRIIGTEQPPRDMRDAPITSQPRMIEPVAAAVGLVHAGQPLHIGVVVEAFNPTLEGFPAHAVIVQIDDIALADRAAWIVAQQPRDGQIRFQTIDGRWWVAPGPSLPYQRIRLVDVGPDAFTAAIGGRVSRLPLFDWFRSLSLGGSHGLMVGLVTYAHALYVEQGIDLAQGRHIAGTGGLIGDGTVTRISGLTSKARAARRAGVDVLFFPAVQIDELDTFDPRGMQMVGVESLADAVAWLHEHPTSA